MATPRMSRSRQDRLGFSLVEMLVVISVVILISAVLFVAFRTARSGAVRAESQTALRSLAQAHASYATEHRGRFIPAYVNASLLNGSVPLEVELADGFSVPVEARQTWVWRLSPYLDHAWRTAFGDADASTMSRLGTQYSNRELVEISERPRYGLNGIFIGGDSDSAGGAVASQNPFTGSGPSIAATRMSEVRNPASLVLFAPTRRVTGAGPSDPDSGWFELRAPFLQDQQWQAITDASGASSIVAVQTIDGQVAGIPFIRRGERVFPVGYLDGSAGVVEADSVANDMRSWAAQATGLGWVVGE